jgi:hypothetical protein
MSLKSGYRPGLVTSSLDPTLGNSTDDDRNDNRHDCDDNGNDDIAAGYGAGIDCASDIFRHQVRHAQAPTLVYRCNGS